MSLTCQEAQNKRIARIDPISGTTKFTKINDMMTNQKELQMDLRIAFIFL